MLALFTQDHPVLSAAQVMEALGSSRASTRMLLASMVDAALLRPAGTRLYSVGRTLWAAGETARWSSPLTRAAFETLPRLARATYATVELVARDGDRAVCVDRAESQGPVIVDVPPPGSLRDPRASAGGRLLFGRRPTLRLPRTEVTDNDPDPETVRSTIRSHGFALDNGESVPGVSCLSAAVLDSDLSPAAALTVIVAASRLEADHQAICRSLLAAGVELSRDLRSLNSIPEFP